MLARPDTPVVKWTKRASVGAITLVLSFILSTVVKIDDRVRATEISIAKRETIEETVREDIREIKILITEIRNNLYQQGLKNEQIGVK